MLLDSHMHKVVSFHDEHKTKLHWYMTENPNWIRVRIEFDQLQLNLFQSNFVYYDQLWPQQLDLAVRVIAVDLRRKIRSCRYTPSRLSTMLNQYLKFVGLIIKIYYSFKAIDAAKITYCTYFHRQSHTHSLHLRCNPQNIHDVYIVAMHLLHSYTYNYLETACSQKNNNE